MNTNFCHDNTADGVWVGKNTQDFYIQTYINKSLDSLKLVKIINTMALLLLLGP